MGSHIYLAVPRISRRKAIEAATQVWFYQTCQEAISKEELRRHLMTIGFGVLTSAEMSDVWRHSKYFEPDLDERMYPEGDSAEAPCAGV